MTRSKWWVSLAALVVLGTASVRAQEPPKYLLKESVAAGDVSEVETEFGMAMDTKAVFQGKTAPAISISSRERQKYREEVLAAGSKGPSALRRTYSIAREAEKTPEGQKVRVLSLQGKTVVLKKAGSKTAVTVNKGKLSAEDRRELLDDLNTAEGQFFADRPVAIGEEWEVDAARLASSFGDFGKDSRVAARGRLEEIVERHGIQCARVSIQLQVEGQPSAEPYRMSMDFRGELLHALDLQRTLSVQAAGPVTLRGKQDGIQITGEGNAEFRWTHRPVKVAGKPVVMKPATAAP